MQRFSTKRWGFVEEIENEGTVQYPARVGSHPENSTTGIERKLNDISTTNSIIMI